MALLLNSKSYLNRLIVPSYTKNFSSFKRSFVISNGEEVERVGETLQGAPKLDRITQFAKLVDQNLPKNPSLKDILKGVWANEVITSQCPDLVIRLTSLRGQVQSIQFSNQSNFMIS